MRKLPKEVKAESRAYDRVQYWQQRRIEATTIPELEYARRMEEKATAAWSAASKARQALTTA